MFNSRTIKLFVFNRFVLLLTVYTNFVKSLPSAAVGSSNFPKQTIVDLNGITVNAQYGPSVPYFDFVDSDDDTSLFIFNYGEDTLLNDRATDEIIKRRENQINRPHISLANTGNVQLVNTDNRNFWEWIQDVLGLATTTQKPVLDKPENCEPCQCGILNSKRIVGGHDTEVNEYPWMTLLIHNNRFYCGGTLINDRYVMTAAHCTSGIRLEKLKVRLMEHDRSSNSESEVIDRGVKRIVRHPKYSNTNYNNDIALLEMDMPVTLKSPLRPVCMPQKGKSFSGLDGIVTGWGATEESGSVASKLQEVTVPIMSNMQCKGTAYKDKITDNMICAGFPEGMKDSCQGDSGGPMHVVNSTTNLYQVVGIVSWGEGCAQPDKPGVYTRVNRYLTWIKSNTPNACYCSSSQNTEN